MHGSRFDSNFLWNLKICSMLALCGIGDFGGIIGYPFAALLLSEYLTHFLGSLAFLHIFRFLYFVLNPPIGGSA